MTSKKQTITKKENFTTRDAAVMTLTGAPDQVDADFKNALLIVSLTVNAFILIAWLVLKVTSDYDYQIATFLFYR